MKTIILLVTAMCAAAVSSAWIVYNRVPEPMPTVEAACLLETVPAGENFIISEDQAGEYNYSLIATARGDIEVWGNCK